MKSLREELCSFFSFAMGIMAGFVTPALWLLATNTTKAPGNNPEGEMFQVPGWVLLVFLTGGILAAEVVMVKKSSSIWRFVIPAALVVGGVIGRILWG